MPPLHRFLTIVIAIVLVSAGTLADAATTSGDEGAAFTAAWAEAYNSREPERVLALYDAEAVFWGTVSPTLRDTPEQIRDYFKNMPDRPHARVLIGEHRVRVFGDLAIATGYYTFTNVGADGTTDSNPSRFSFVYRKRNGRWLIVDHHSSRVPASGG